MRATQREMSQQGPGGTQRGASSFIMALQSIPLPCHAVRATASRLLIQRLVKIHPVRIIGFDAFEFHYASPFLDELFTTNRHLDIGMRFNIDESLDPVFFCKSIRGTDAMFIRPARQITGYANIQRPSIA